MIRNLVMFIGGAISGGIAGIMIMCLLSVPKSSKNKMSKIKYTPYYSFPLEGQGIYSIPVQTECQIHPSYACLGQENCKGNPSYCEMAVLKNG